MAFLALALLQSNPIGDALNNTEWAFPLAECFHIVFFGIAIGTIMIVNLRLMGLAFPRRTPAQLAHDTWVWTLLGLVITTLAGMALFISDPRMYYYNQGFRFKFWVFWRPSFITTRSIPRWSRPARRAEWARWWG